MTFSLILTSVLILSGAVVMAVNISRFKSIPGILKRFSLSGYRELILLFRFHMMLMVFFFLGYLIVFMAMVLKAEIFGGVLVGVIFFFGAIFVFFGIRLQSRMLDQIKECYEIEISMGSELEKERNQLKETNLRLEAEVEDRRLIQNALQESEEHMQAIMQNLQAGVVVLDGETHEILEANQQAVRMIGAPDENILGKVCHEFICPAERGACPISDLGQQVDNSERILLKANDERIPILKTAHAVTLGNRPVIIESFIDMTNLKLAEDRIKASLREKEVLLKEIHHRVKNNLQIISSLLNLQSNKIKQKEILELFRESQNRIQAIAFMHETLYQSEDFSKIDFGNYLKGLTEKLHQLYETDQQSIQSIYDLEAIEVPIDLAIPCGLIVNELVSNAFKHAFPLDSRKDGTIKISVRALEDNQVRVTVRDDGIGFSPDISIKEAETLGMQLVTSLVEHQLGGTLRVERSSGMAFHITFGSEPQTF